MSDKAFKAAEQFIYDRMRWYPHCQNPGASQMTTPEQSAAIARIRDDA